MIPGAIRAAFQWWAKHPWKVFWGILFLPYLIFLPIALLPLSTLISLFEFDPASEPGIFGRPLFLVSIIFFGLWQIVLILSFFRGMFLMWRRSKVAVVMVVVSWAVLTWLMLPFYFIRQYRGYDSEVRVNIRNAAAAQKAYFEDNGTYTDSVSSLKEYGYKQDSNVTIDVVATANAYVVKQGRKSEKPIPAYVITGTRKKVCKANTGTWSINSVTHTINGTSCSPPSKWYTWD